MLAAADEVEGGADADEGHVGRPLPGEGGEGFLLGGAEGDKADAGARYGDARGGGPGFGPERAEAVGRRLEAGEAQAGVLARQDQRRLQQHVVARAEEVHRHAGVGGGGAQRPHEIGAGDADDVGVLPPGHPHHRRTVGGDVGGVVIGMTEGAVALELDEVIEIEREHRAADTGQRRRDDLVDQFGLMADIDRRTVDDGDRLGNLRLPGLFPREVGGQLGHEVS